MTTLVERVASLDEFMAARKTVVRPDMQGAWRAGQYPDERQLGWPLEVDGIQIPDAFLNIVGYPLERDLRFRIMIDAPVALCRLDYADETHTNADALSDSIPPLVHGPHYHRWSHNRRFFTVFEHKVRLRNAVPYNGGGATFDAVLRWFCDDTNIEPLPPTHLIELPRLDTLL